MARTAFDSRLGTGQGRIPGPSDFATGSQVFALGDAQPGWTALLNVGDHAEVTQEADLTEADLVRVRLRLRVPAEVPTGLAWEASIIVDGEKRARTVGRPGRTRDVLDLAANVSKLSGTHTVGVRLELVEA